LTFSFQTGKLSLEDLLVRLQRLDPLPLLLALATRLVAVDVLFFDTLVLGGFGGALFRACFFFFS
jgi:hypothetical protein